MSAKILSRFWHKRSEAVLPCLWVVLGLAFLAPLPVLCGCSPSQRRDQYFGTDAGLNYQIPDAATFSIAAGAGASAAGAAAGGTTGAIGGATSSGGTTGIAGGATGTAPPEVTCNPVGPEVRLPGDPTNPKLTLPPAGITAFHAGG